MTREQSQIIKGVAILLMLFFHLFSESEFCQYYTGFFLINGEPLAKILARATHPVSFFLILGGYGLYKVWKKGNKNRWSRLWKLYIHYWIILVIFLSIGYLKDPDRYPGSFLNIIENFTSYSTSYNHVMWFLLPYVILSILSPWIFKILRNIKWYWIIGGSLFIHFCTSFCISRFGASFLYHTMWAYNPLLVCHLLFSFCLGYVAARDNYFEKLNTKVKSIFGSYKGLISWSMIALLVFINCIFKYNFFYAFLIISCISVLNIYKPIQNVLIKLGNMSMNMWMIHTWFCYYLFQDFIYSFKYPILIFLVLVVISYISARVINLIANPIEGMFLTKREIKEKPIL